MKNARFPLGRTAAVRLKRLWPGREGDVPRACEDGQLFTGNGDRVPIIRNGVGGNCSPGAAGRKPSPGKSGQKNFLPVLSLVRAVYFRQAASAGIGHATSNIFTRIFLSGALPEAWDSWNRHKCGPRRSLCLTKIPCTAKIGKIFPPAGAYLNTRQARSRAGFGSGGHYTCPRDSHMFRGHAL